MTGWIIFGSILLILILILMISVTVTAIYDADPEVRIKILCFTIIKIPADPKTLEKKKRKQKKKEEKERRKLEKQQKKAVRKKPETAKENTETAVTGTSDNRADKSPAVSDNTEADKKSAPEESRTGGSKPQKAEKAKKPKKKLNISLDMIMDYVRSASPPIKRLFRKIRIRDVYVDWVVGSDEAGKTALKYGGLCTAFYSLQELLDTYFDAKIKEINIEADFQAEKDDIFIYAIWKLRIGTALGCALWLGVRVLKTFLKYNSKPKAKKSQKARMKPAAGRGR